MLRCASADAAGCAARDTGGLLKTGLGSRAASHAVPGLCPGPRTRGLAPPRRYAASPRGSPGGRGPRRSWMFVVRAGRAQESRVASEPTPPGSPRVGGQPTRDF